MKYKLLWYLNLFEPQNFTNALHTNSRYLEKWKKGRPLLLFPNPPYGNDKSVLRPCFGNGHSFFTTSHI